VTLVEVAVVVAILGVLAALGAPALDRFLAHQRLRAAARSMADVFRLARAEAIRSGNPHVVLLSAAAAGDPPATDPAGTPLGIDPRTGGPWPAVVLNDGLPAVSNCAIDPGEPTRTIPSERGVAWGFAVSGGVRAPGDVGAGDPASGSSFSDANGSPVTWVLFRADGVPRAFDAACNVGAIGEGGGGVYLTNGRRDYAIVLTPLGGVRVHAWDAGAAAWTD
jgi:type II secretory pathway pseudopilin PulG